MKIYRFLIGLHGLFAALATAVWALTVAMFAIPGDVLLHVRMSIADYAAKLGRDLKARRLMFAMSLWHVEGHGGCIGGAA